MKFGRLTDVLNNVKNLDQEIIFIKILHGKDVQQFILTLNGFEQLFRDGIQANGSPLKSTNSTNGVYSELTEIFNEGRKFELGGLTKEKIAGDPYFLVDTGKFFQSLEIKIVDDGFVIDADTIKPKVDMINEYGDILGLTDENRKRFIQEIIPLVKSEVFSLLLK